MKAFDAALQAANPVVRMRERLGYTRADFARATGVPYSTVARTENGLTHSLPQSIRQAAAACGEDPDKLAAEFAAWSAELRAAYAKKKRA
jgi:transcriptional regulator with XRE-family HTH domain